MRDLLEEHFFTWTITAVVVVLGAIWAFNRVTCGICKSTTRMDGKTVLITGCSSGLGEATAMDLARRGARIIMASTNLEKNYAVRDKIIAATSNTNIVVRRVDMSLMSSVREFAQDIKDSQERLDVLIHNAGIYLPSNIQTEEGLNTVLAVNVFGPFLLTHLLIDLLKKTRKSRIIFVSSILHMFGNVNLNNPNPLETIFWLKFYVDSKFAVVLLANEMGRRLSSSEITVNSLHPGVVYTKIFDGVFPLTYLLLKLMNPIFFKTVEEGSQTTNYLAVSDEVEGVSGKYFTDCKEWFSASGTKNEDLAKKYWKICEDLVKLQPSDPHIN